MKTPSKTAQLKQCQQLFRDLLHGKAGKTPVPLRGTPRAYTYAYLIRILESLVEDFPSVHLELGAKRFEALCVDFLNAKGSRSYSLSGVSLSFLDYLKSKRLKDVLKSTVAKAELDWAACLALVAPEPEVDLIHFGTVQTQEQAAGLVLTLHPSVHFVRNQIVWRMNSVQKDKVSAWERKIFDHLKRPGRNGSSFLDLTAWLESQKLTDKMVHKFFAKWAQLGVVIGFERKGTLH